MAVTLATLLVLSLATAARSDFSSSSSFSSSVPGSKPVAVTFTEGEGAEALAAAANPSGGTVSHSKGDNKETGGFFQTLFGFKKSRGSTESEGAKPTTGPVTAPSLRPPPQETLKTFTAPKTSEEIQHSLYTVYVPAAKYGLPPDSVLSAPPAPGSFLPPDGALLAPPPPVINNIPLPAPRRLTYYY